MLPLPRPCKATTYRLPRGPLINLGKITAFFCCSTPRNKPASSGCRPAASVSWIAGDKGRRGELIARIRQWNDGLAELLPEVKRQRISHETISESIARTSPRGLEYIERATEKQYPLISRSAGVRSMSLRCRSDLSLRSHARTSLGRPQWRLPVDSFEWSPLGLKSDTSVTSVTTNAVTVDLAEAATSERAFAMLLNENGETPSGSSNDSSAATPVMVEWRDDFRSEESFKQFETRLDYLVLILRKMAANGDLQEQPRKGSTTYDQISLLPCLGWTTTSPQFERIGLVFDLTERQHSLSSSIPNTPTAPPSAIVSLHQLISRDRDPHIRNPSPPALGDRFGLAFALALNLSNLSSVGWVHKEFRSHNVLFLGSDDNTCTLDHPFLAGFTYARPSRANLRDLSLLNPDPAYDMYRPPRQIIHQHQQRQTALMSLPAKSGVINVGYMYDERDDDDDDDSDKESSISDDVPECASTWILPADWTAAMDVYGLGIVLLEIGMWRTVQDLRGSDKIPKSKFLERSLPGLVESLSYRVGNLYMGVVKKCLELGDWVDDEVALRDFWADTLESLALCRA